MAQPEPWSYLPRLLRTSPSHLPLANDDIGDIGDSNTLQLKPNLSQILRSRRIRVLGATVAIMVASAYFFYGPATRFDFNYPHTSDPSNSAPLAESAETRIDWSRFAYTQYVTNTDYLCNSVMLFETLHRLGSRADRLMMYPASMQVDATSSNQESQLLLKAQKEYGVNLLPVEIQHRASKDGESATWADSYTKLLAFNQTQYDRVLSLDSDSTVLQHMDELFLLPPAPVAMPRAYWMKKPYLSSQLVLIQPSVEEFKRVKDAIDHATDGDFDMEIVNNLYGKDCMVIPHRRYDLLTGEFRSHGKHQNYLGNTYETWDPEKMAREAKFLHFSDWPMPKPWLSAPDKTRTDVQPTCETDSQGREDCRARDIWLGFYSDFKRRRQDICGLDPGGVIRDLSGTSTRSLKPVVRRSWEFVPNF